MNREAELMLAEAEAIVWIAEENYSGRWYKEFENINSDSRNDG